MINIILKCARRRVTRFGRTKREKTVAAPFEWIVTPGDRLHHRANDRRRLRPTASAVLFGAIAVFISFWGRYAEAAPWPQAPGDGFVETRSDYFTSTDAFGRFERFDGAIYGEYGLFPSLMVGGKAIYGTSRQISQTSQRSASGVSEIEGFVQYTVHWGDWDVVSVRAAGIRPASLSAGVRPEIAADGVDVDVRALYGRTLRDFPHKIFITAETALRKRLGDAADEVRLDAGLGYEPANNWLFLLETQSTLSLRNNQPGAADFDVLKVQPSIVWAFSDCCSLRVGGVIEATARNLTPGAGGFLALWSFF
ncbi:MAG: hypothetical protein AAF224_04310 [Pseudomonadota bacterium]